MIDLKPLSKNPLVSIIVPSFNQGSFIRQTIESILEQNYRPIEVWVIDGASTDNTLEVLHKYDNVFEISWISEPDSGVVEAVNKGLARAKGEIGGIQSSDDFYLPGAISVGVKELCSNLDLGFVFGDIIKIDSKGNELSHYILKPFSVENVLSLQTWIPQPACFFRMDLAKELGGWREEVPYSADTDLWFRMMIKSKAKKIDVFMSKRRVHDKQRNTHVEKIIRDYNRMINDLFERFGAMPSLRPAAEAGILLLRNRYSCGEKEEIKFNRIEEAKNIFPSLKDALMPPPSIQTLLWEIFRRLKIKLLG